jgi:hypothetical protein
MELQNDDLIDCNYVEIYLCENTGIHSSNYYETGLSKDQFYSKMNILLNDNYKYFQKEYKQYVIGTLLYENNNNEEVRVFRKECKKILCSSNLGYLAIFYQKSKITMLNLPSTSDIHDVSYVRKLTFRVNNRIYINFECKQRKNEEIQYSIYINYNHDDAVDMTVTNNVLNKLITKLIS